MLKQLRSLVTKYLSKQPNHRERAWLEKRNGSDMMEKTVKEIYRKVFVNDG